MPVNDQHKEYRKNLPLWGKVGDCVEGAEAVKSKGTTYLPKPNPSDDSSENAERYSQYKTRASFVGFTGHTKAGLLGLVFRKNTKVELPANLEYLKQDANGAGLSLDQMARSATGETLEAGRHGLLTDYPEASPGLSRAQVEQMKLRANILAYPAKSILNWRTEQVGGVTMLSLVVLAEPVEEVAPDGFSVDEKTRYRVLRLEDGLYHQEIYSDDGELVGFSEPKNASGQRWKEIPFAFSGSQNNDPSVDKAPLLDIAELNIAHYRNSADYEESSFMVGQPTPYVAGLSQAWVDEVMKGGLMLGSRTAWALPDGGSAGLLQADPNQMPLKGMGEKEQQMIKIGAKIITDTTGQETAEGAKIRFAGSTSQLGILVGNVEAAMIKSIKWCGEFMGESGDPELEINRQFYDATLDPQMVIAQIQLLDRGVIATNDVRDGLRRGGMISDQRTNEDIDTEAETAEIL